VLCDGPLRVRGGLDGIPCSREGDEERLRLAIDDDSGVARERLFEDSAMLCDDLLVPIAEAMLELRRAFDVGEEQCDRPVRELAHATIVTPSPCIRNDMVGSHGTVRA